MRTAARLGDLFPTDGDPAGKEKAARDKGQDADGATDPSTIVVGPGPWPGGPRPPIIVVGVSDIVSVLPKTGPVQPTIIGAAPPTIISATPAPEAPAPPPIIISATPPAAVAADPLAPADPIVVVATETVVAEHVIVPAKPIGLATAAADEPKLTPVMAEPHEGGPAKPIGVMARAGDAVGEDTWRLPEPTPAPVPALARAVPAAPGLPAAAHVFAKQANEDRADDDLASLVRTKAVHETVTRPAPERTTAAVSATSGRVPRTRPVVARAQAERSASATSPAAPPPERRRRSGTASAERPTKTQRPAPAERTRQAAAPKARSAPKPQPAKARVEPATAQVIPTAPPAAQPRVEPARARVEPAPTPAAKARPATKARSATKKRSAGKTRSVPTAAPTAYCPYCAKLLDPAPTASRRCDRCRQRIVVKRIDGTSVYLTEAAVLVFEAERRRVMASVRWARDRDRWLQHAAAAGAPAERMAQLAVARLSAEVVSAARKLFLNTVDRAFRTARNEGDWDEASRLRRDEAAVLYRFAGSPAQPPDEVIAIFRDGVAAELRGVAAIARDAELVSARCCDICRGDDRLVARISTELRSPRLPHAGCPRGLCRCHWDLATKDRLTMRRYLRRRPSTELRLAQAPEEETPSATSVPAGQDRVG